MKSLIQSTDHCQCEVTRSKSPKWFQWDLSGEGLYWRGTDASGILELKQQRILQVGQAVENGVCSIWSSKNNNLGRDVHGIDNCLQQGVVELIRTV